VSGVPAPEAILGFALASVLLVVVPGPSVLFAIARSLSLGRTAGLVTVLGNTLGQVPLILAVALGVGAVIATSAILFTVIKLLGAAYLVYLGVQAIRHRREGAEIDGLSPEATTPSLMRIFLQGFVVGVSNPKSIVFFLAVLPQFVNTGAGAVPMQMMVLGVVFVVIACVSDACYAFLAGTARTWFAQSTSRLSRVRAAGGVVMIGLGGALAVSK
jgi:threonine/homoserine/homoserine lactone efflux protein